MAHRLLRSALAGLVGAGLLASHATPAQNTTTPETPVGFTLPDNLGQTDSFGPPLEFGVAVATVGKTAFVGAPLYENTNGPLDANGNATSMGVVEVYESDATGANWTLIDSLTPVVPKLDGFGQSVAVSGDLLAVSSGSQIQLYEKRRGKWTPTETIPVVADNMVLVGNTLAVYSAPDVLVYEIGFRCKPRLVQTLKPLSGDTGHYGSQIALEGDLLVVGSPGTFVEPSQPGPAPPGQVYVYSREGFFFREGRWHLEQTLQSPTGASGSEFGTGVGISRHAIIVGAPGEDNNFDGFSTTEGGEAYVFKKAHGVWAETQEFRTTGGGGEGFNAFGTLMATGGGRVVISAPGADDVFSAAFGPTTIFRWEGGMLVQDGLAATGNSLGASRDHVIVGTNYDGRGGFFEGAQVLTYPKASADD